MNNRFHSVKKTISIITFISIFTLLTAVDSISQSRQLSWKFEKTPCWTDEFENSVFPDTSKWKFETGGDGWGNNELQYYTNGANVKIKNGVLKITGRKEKIGGRKFTSSRLVTKGKADWKYGKIEVRAKLPKGRGTWPAVWMLPANDFYGEGLPSGEIDIMEHVGFEPDVIHFSVHTEKFNSSKKNEKTGKTFAENADEEFHVYKMEWTPYGIRGYVDEEKYFEYKNTNSGYRYWPFDKNFFLIINLAIGGSWGGEKGIDNKIFPAEFEIDFVRVYKFLQ